MVSQGAPSEVTISAREAEVLSALGEHLSNAEIGARLYISIRTVESHVSSLLRKLRVDDRRALAGVAANLPIRAGAVLASLPSPLTPFVGRVAERAALTQALHEQRLVTAVGPGGVGKTRLALSVAADMADAFADGVWYVDLVPVTDPAMIAPAIAGALGLGERQGHSAADNVLSWLADREALLVLDNCEHLLDGVVVLLERLLAGSTGLTVLATSRARLLVPFEWVFPVPGMSVEADRGGPGDAVALFLARAEAGGSPSSAEEQKRIGAVCRDLDGMALAIELAAARYASLGLDGLEAGLADRLRLLTGGPRVDDRHRSLRSTLDWSYALLEEPDQAVLRRVSVFAAPFTADAAAVVLADWPPVPAGAIPSVLAGLAEQSLLVAIAQPGGTRYRALETVRQYGSDRLADAGEALAARSRHLNWCIDTAAALAPAAVDGGGTWRAAFDHVADEMRDALRWAADVAELDREAHGLAIRLAELTFTRGMPGESQRRYEQAAVLAADDRAAAAALHYAAGAAESRHFGNEALRLRRAAADAAIRAGDRASAAAELARAAELISRGPGIIAIQPADGAVDALLTEARQLADDDPGAVSRILTAEAFAGDETDPRTTELAERALELARTVGDSLSESAALDQLTAVHLVRGDIRAAMASAMRRTELLAGMQMTADSGFEFSDGLNMAAETAIAAGDLRAARVLAEHGRDLPFHREEAHIATARLIVVAALAGDFDEVLSMAERYREGWERAGRPRIGNLSRAAYAAGTVHGLRGADDARAAWLEIVDAVALPGLLDRLHYGKFYDALLLLHRGQPDLAMKQLQTSPEDFNSSHDGMWRPWFAALWAEAAVLAGDVAGPDRIRRARLITAENPTATAIVERSAALVAGVGERAGLSAAAAALEAAGCRYQWARTLVFIGGPDRARGESVLASMGTTRMAWPPE